MRRNTRKPQLEIAASLTAKQFASIAVQDSPERAYAHFALQTGLYSLRQVGEAIREYQECQTEPVSALISSAERDAESMVL